MFICPHRLLVYVVECEPERWRIDHVILLNVPVMNCFIFLVSFISVLIYSLFFLCDCVSLSVCFSAFNLKYNVNGLVP